MTTELNIETMVGVYPLDHCRELLSELLNYPYEQLKFSFNGKTFIPQRKVAAYGDAGLSYAFSGNRVAALPWTPTLLTIKEEVQKRTGDQYNFVLLNLYPNGTAKISAHRDDEKELDPAASIATLSLGAARTMLFARKNFATHRVPLENGSLLLMKPPTNHHWTHEIPAQPEVKEPRVSLTFRRIIPAPVPLQQGQKRPADTDINASPAPKKTSECLKEWNLGYGFMVSIQRYDSKLYVHIRQYNALNDTFYPSNQGIVMTTRTLVEFQHKIFAVDTKYPKSSAICNNQLLILSNNGELLLKQLFYANDNYTFKDSFLKVDYNNMFKIREIIPDILQNIKRFMLENVLPSEILKHCTKNHTTNLDLKHELLDVLREEIQCNVRELFYCEACIINDGSAFNHDCVTATLEEQFYSVGKDALLIVNVKRVVEALQQKNMLHFYDATFFKTLCYEDYMEKLLL